MNQSPTIVRQPLSQTIVEGDSVSFSVTATGAPPLNYQWLKDGESIPGETSRTLTIMNATLADSGALYSVRVENSAGSVTSDSAQLMVKSDSDGDRMPDDWEENYGLNPSDPSDGTDDSDGDGFTNREEYRGGSDPLDANSVPGCQRGLGPARENFTFSAIPGLQPGSRE